MRSHEIFQRISPALAAQIFTFLQTDERPTYKAAVQGLANQRNLRAVFVERRPPNERHRWMQAALSRNVSEAIASHLLQAWLLGANKQMLCDFLDSLGVSHDEDGTVETIPPSPPREKIETAVNQLFDKYPPEVVAVYLHAFCEMDTAVQWPPLEEMLMEESRLKL